MVTYKRSHFQYLCDQLLIRPQEPSLDYQYGITKQIISSPVDRLLRDLLGEHQAESRICAARSIGDLGFQQFELDILSHVAKHDVSLGVRAAARMAIVSITGRLEQH